jgi:5'-nucleotidase
MRDAGPNVKDHTTSSCVRQARKRVAVGMRHTAFFVAVLVGWSALALPLFAQSDGTVDVTVLAINDFHGNLLPPAGGMRIADPKDRSKKISVPAGGAEHMATLVKELRGQSKNTIFVAAGDLIGASPLLSGIFHDEPTIESLSAMGLAISAVGNHEFDEGKDELLRMQNGGCHPTDGCRGPHPFTGAKFRYLAASTVDIRTGATLLPAYEIREFDGIPIAFIGLTLKGTPDLVIPSGVAGLEFRDEVETVNALVPKIRQQGVEAIVVLIHEGGFPTGVYNECPGISGPIVDIVKGFDKAVDIVVSGHTHQAYNCLIDGRRVTSADRHGRLVTKIDLKLDKRTRDIVGTRADNIIVRTDTYAKDPEQTALIAPYRALAEPLANRVVGSVTATLPARPNEAGESVLGNIVADAQLAATADGADGAVIAFTNPGGVRAPIEKRGNGEVTYADVYASQPFANQLVTLTLSGAQIRELLEQQWDPGQPQIILYVSRGFAYAWDSTRPFGQRVVPESITLNGQRLAPDARVRVTVNNFLAAGGDGFSVFLAGTDRRFGMFDVKALDTYVAANSPLSPGPLDRITRLR